MMPEAVTEDAQIVYHRIDPAGARPIRQPPRRLPLVKEALVNDLLDDMKSPGVIE